MSEKQGAFGFRLDKVVEQSTVHEDKGIFIRDLRAGDIVTIRTKNYTYFLKLTDPAKGKAEVTGTDPLLQKIVGLITALGSTLIGTGSMLKVGWVAVGFRFQLGYRVQELEPGKLSNGLNLQPTESVSVNGVQLLPVVDQTAH